MRTLPKVLLSTAAAATLAGGLTTVTAAEADAAGTVLRVTTAASAVKDSAGNTWSPSSAFVGGTQVDRTTSADIKGTSDDRLYQTERWGVRSWSAAVPNGDYDVTLKQAETWYSTPSTRVFSVTAEGRAVVSNLDLVAVAGKNVAVDRTFRVSVTDGRLDLGFSATKDSAKAAGILVRSVTSNTGVVTPTPRPTNPTPTIPTTTPTPTPTPAPSTPPASTAGPWKSGASGTGVTNGDFGRWRGSEVTVSSTWSDNNTAAANFWQLNSSGEYGNWNKDLDVAVGGIGPGESWAAGANGAYDARWRQSLTKLRDLRAGKSGTVYIRFAHEMNGNWYPWSVDKNNYRDFVSSWKRYRALQKEIFPAAKMVFNVNRESVSTGFDWRLSFPGAAYVDVMGVDYYNQYPYVATQGQFDSAAQQTDAWGAPKGLAKHLEFAKSVGLPLSVSEWSGNADAGDSPAFVQGMHDFFEANGGTGAGKLLYEVQFNVDKDNRRWLLTSGTRQPNAAAKYRDLF
ncbi:malectin domain-containing carbohydrate-binding protein [Kineococcus gynurae]|uniref:Malectin domain-containing carbohydrate-binding protein n=1 Tax=Kineococcus gynurae TaxID=452979 RepID=A0ABV5LTR3_9ACTN